MLIVSFWGSCKILHKVNNDNEIFFSIYKI